MTRNDEFTIIAAIDRERGIGKDGGIPWTLPGDLRRFATITIGMHPKKTNAVIMGKATYRSLPQKYRPLPRRLNVVVTSDASFPTDEGVKAAASLSEALKVAQTHCDGDLYVIGGEQLYAEALTHPQCARLLLTRVDGAFSCDRFFPAFEDRFALDSVLPGEREGGLAYDHATYRRTNVIPAEAGIQMRWSARAYQDPRFRGDDMAGRRG